MPIFINDIRKSLTEYNIPMVSLLLARRSDYLQGKSVALTANNLNTNNTNGNLTPGQKSAKIISLTRSEDEMSVGMASTTSYSKFREETNTYPKVIQQMLKTNFYLSKSETLQNTTIRDSIVDKSVKILTRLHGRRTEIEHIICFLFTALVSQTKTETNENITSTNIIPFNGSISQSKAHFNPSVAHNGSMMQKSPPSRPTTAHTSESTKVFNIECKARYVGE